jgi:hypothetical protein
MPLEHYLVEESVFFSTKLFFVPQDSTVFVAAF